MNNDLTQYLLARGINIMDRGLDPKITEDEKILSAVAGAWATNSEEIKAVVRSRMAKIREHIIVDSLPVEVPVLRQALVELAGILEDFEKYTAEFEKRGS